MTLLRGEYVPSAQQWVRDQVDEYEASGGARANTLRGGKDPIVVITSGGRKSGALRKNPLMRVERDGKYLAVASIGGAPTNPEWYHNFLANPIVELQDGPSPGSTARGCSTARSARTGGRTPCRPGRRTASTRPAPSARSRCSCSRRSDPDRSPVGARIVTE